MVKRKATDNSTVPEAPKKPKANHQWGVDSSQCRNLFPSTQQPPGTPIQTVNEMKAKYSGLQFGL